MKIHKAERITKVKVSFNRGEIEGDVNGDFFKLKIRAIRGFIEDENYCYWNWGITELRELADSINAFLKEVNPLPLKPNKLKRK